MTFLVFGTLVHIAIGLGLHLAFRWGWGVVAAIFLAKEWGELKYRLPGSVKTVEKNLAILAELLTDPVIVLQWLLPAVAVWGVSRYLRARRKNDGEE